MKDSTVDLLLGPPEAPLVPVFSIVSGLVDPFILVFALDGHLSDALAGRSGGRVRRSKTGVSPNFLLHILSLVGDSFGLKTHCFISLGTSAIRITTLELSDLGTYLALS